MKIKYLAIALLSTVLVSSPIMANDKDIHKPLVVTRAVDKATPAVAPDTDVTEVAKEMLESEADEMGARTKGETTLGDISVAKEIDKSSPMLSRDAASGLPTGKREHKPLSLTKAIDKSSPMSSVMDQSCNAKDNECDSNTLKIRELDKSSTKAASSGYMKLGDIKGEAMESAEGNSDSSSSKAFMKIEGVVGESQDKAVGGSSGAIAGIAVGAAVAPDESNTDTSTAHKKGYDYYRSASAGAKEACAEIKEKGTEEQLKTCIDGHVTVLK